MTERKVQYRTFKQDPSGHMSMDAQTAGFFREANFRENKILKLQQAGAIQHRHERNPLAAERSPRNEGRGFDTSVPAAVPEQPRWAIPDTDWGLMAKFSSQKEIYEAIYERERNFGREAELVREAQRQKAHDFEAERKKKEELQKAAIKKNAKEEDYYRQLEKLAINPHLQSNTHHAKSMTIEQKQQMEREIENMIHEFDKSQNPKSSKGLIRRQSNGIRATDVDFSRHSDPRGSTKLDHSSPAAFASSLQNSLKIEERALLHNKDLSTMKASQIREVLTETHPEVLAQYRAERAAKFIEKRAENAINPPPHRELSQSTFRPAGGTVSLEKVKALPSQAKTMSTDRNHRSSGSALNAIASVPSIPIAALQLELAKTQADVDRQQLKLSLHSNSKLARLHAGK